MRTSRHFNPPEAGRSAEMRGVLVGAVAAIVGVALVIKPINKRKAKQVEAVEVDD